MSETKPLSYDELRAAVDGDACAFRCRTTLQPAGGEGTKVFPPTYAGGVYAVEKRRLPGREEPATCVLLDSVQSQANRMEAALQQAVDAGLIELPLIEVDFAEANETLLKPIDDRVTSLTAPHRLADAILRDSLVAVDGEDEGKLFRDSSYAGRWRRASVANAMPVYELCPTALLFGVWGAPEKPGGLGAKFQRCITSEVVGIDAVLTESRQGLRRDPLGIQRKADVIVGDANRWENATVGAKKTKRPSEINHGPIPFGPAHGGVTFSKAEQTAVLTLAGLRWLRFPADGSHWQPTEEQKSRDAAARTVLAALGLYAAAKSQQMGHDFRSGCLLHSAEPMHWELIAEPGAEPARYEISPECAGELLASAVEAAQELGLTWRREALKLKPSNELIELVRRSQQLAAEKGEEGE